MNKKSSFTDENILLTYKLAFFIHRNKEIALKIAYKSLLSLKQAAAIEAKRLSYSLKSRNLRTKIALTNQHLLQKLVYLHSELFEKKQEHNLDQLDEEDMIVRYIKHLILSTITFGSFNVLIGLCKFLFNYTTKDRQKIYDYLMTDPIYGKDDDRYRKCKKAIKIELQDRFGDLLKIVTTGQQREELFESIVDPHCYALLVDKCLEQFTPWDTSCMLPQKVDDKTLSLLPCKNDKPDQMQKYEILRIHSIIHKSCLAKLIDNFKLPPLEKSLTIPKFYMNNKDNNPTRPSRYAPPALSKDELQDIREELEAQLSFMKKQQVKGIVITVDNNEYGSLTLDKNSTLQIKVKKGAKLIQFFPNNVFTDVPLGLFFIPYDLIENSDQLSLETTIRFNGYNLTCHFAIIEGPENDNGIDLLDLKFIYIKQSLFASISTTNIFNKLLTSLSYFKELLSPASYRPSIWIVLSLLVILIIGMIYQFSSKNITKLPNKDQYVNNEQKLPTNNIINNKPVTKDEIQANNKPELPTITTNTFQIKDNYLMINKQGQFIWSTEITKLDRQKTTEFIKQLTDDGTISLPTDYQYYLKKEGVVMGETSTKSSLKLLTPVATNIQSMRPIFRWLPVNGAKYYNIYLYKGSEEIEKGNLLTTTEWKLPEKSNALSKGEQYSWQVIPLDKDGNRLELPPLPEAYFEVLSRTSAKQLAHIKQHYIGSHLILGTIYAQQFGLLDDAEHEFKLLYQANPTAPLAKKILINFLSARGKSSEN